MCRCQYAAPDGTGLPAPAAYRLPARAYAVARAGRLRASYGAKLAARADRELDVGAAGENGAGGRVGGNRDTGRDARVAPIGQRDLEAVALEHRHGLVARQIGDGRDRR